VRGGAVW